MNLHESITPAEVLDKAIVMGRDNTGIHTDELRDLGGANHC